MNCVHLKLQALTGEPAHSLKTCKQLLRNQKKQKQKKQQKKPQELLNTLHYLGNAFP